MGWWQSALQTIGLAKAAPISVVSEVPKLIDSGAGLPAAPSFPVVASMATFAEFPWVRACIDAVGADLSGLPLRIVQGEGKDAEVVQVPELAALLAKPQVGVSRRQWERQLLTFLLPTGNAYALKVGNPARPTSLVLLHPESVEVVPDAYGYPAAYQVRSYGGDVKTYSADIIMHIRLTSWENGPQGLLGEGLIRALRNDLNADRAASRLSASQANQGRPTAVFSPKGEEQPTREQRQAVADGYAKAVSENRPCIVLPVGFDASFPSYSMRDMEFVAQRALTRETILAAFSVPPVRVGLPQANFATAREQSAIYWQSLIGLAALLDDALTVVAQGFGAGLSVRHDFSGVESLQQSRDSRLQRVTAWTMLGATPSAAAAYEGFDDAPVSDDDLETEEEPPAAVAVGMPVARWLEAASPKLSLVPDTRALDEEEPRLEQSEYERPPYPFVLDLRDNWPKIWEAGGNIRGNEAFEYWTKYQDGDRSEGVLAWLKEREAWGARHYEDGDAFIGDDQEDPTLSNIGGVVAWLKWGVVGQLGWERIKSLVDQLKAATPADEREAARGALWRGWLSEVQSPAEVSLARATRLALAQQQRSVSDNLVALWDALVPMREAYARRVAALPPEVVRRDILDLLGPILDALFPASVQDMLRTITADAYRRGVRSAFRFGAKQVGANLNADRVDPVANQMLGVMVQRVNATTIDAVAEIVAAGITEGLPIADMQARIQSAVGFSAARALRVARTETTRSVNAGSQYAWQTVAGDSGLTIQKEWLSARDGEVREEHRQLDGQVVPLGGTFMIESGEFAGRKASGPGDFDHAALVVNCRCTVLPKVSDE